MAASGVLTSPRDATVPVGGPDAGRRVLVVSACSKRKLDGGAAGPSPKPVLAARERYAGRSHLRIRDAVDRWRYEAHDARIAWSIVSAGLGLLDETEMVPEYEATFAALSASRARRRGLELGIPAALRERLSGCDAALVVLPLAYLHACGAPFADPPERVYFASPAFAVKSQEAVVVPCGVREARRVGVAPREIAAARFASFVDDAIRGGFRSALAMRGSGDISG